MKVVNDFVEPFVQRAIAQTESNIETKQREREVVNFTDALSLYTKDRAMLRDQLVSTLLAARDTTACALSWLFYELAYHPDVYAKLREEVISIIGIDGKPTYEDLKNMKYMQYCINESTIFI
jgi:cytochrome P450